MSTFEKAKEVKELAIRIVNEGIHEHLNDAMDLIGFYFRDSGMKEKIKTKKCSAFERFTTGYFFTIFVDAAAWRRAMPDQKLALVDHALTHIDRKKEPREREVDGQKKIVEVWADAADPGNWFTKEHDVQDFADIIRRHGLWDSGAEQFADAVHEQEEKQLTLADIMREKEREAMRRAS